MKQPTIPLRATRLALSLVAVAILSSAALGQEPSTTAHRYSYITASEGSSTLLATNTGTRTAADRNLPILVGDRLWTSSAGRVDVLLSDDNRVSVDRNSELSFNNIDTSPETDAYGPTALELRQGRVLVEILTTPASDEVPYVDTANTRVYLLEAGLYLVSANDYDFTEVLVREGFAEVVDQRGSSVVRTAESIVIEGTSRPRTRLAAAAAIDEFERWSYDQGAQLASSDPYLEQPLPGTGSLEEHGDWVVVEKGRAWRPSVAAGWSPYSYGSWVDTPSGFYWHSLDPWSPAVYHYGSWDYNYRYGWVWYPDYYYAPAHVFWYWGPLYVGWVPSGYYYRHYRRYGFDFHHGIFGWAGGSWDPFDRWLFCSPNYFGSRHQHRYHHHGGYRDGHGIGRRLDRGLITADSRGLDLRRVRSPERTRERLMEEWVDRHGHRQIPEADDFVARRELSDDYQRDLRTETVGAAAAAQEARRVATGDTRGRRVALPSDGAVRTPATTTSGRAVSVTPTDTGAGRSTRSDERGASARTRVVPQAGSSSSAGRSARPETSGSSTRPTTPRVVRPPSESDSPSASSGAAGSARAVPSSSTDRQQPTRRVLDSIRGRRSPVPSTPSSGSGSRAGARSDGSGSSTSNRGSSSSSSGAASRQPATGSSRGVISVPTRSPSRTTTSRPTAGSRSSVGTGSGVGSRSPVAVPRVSRPAGSSSRGSTGAASSSGRRVTPSYPSSAGSSTAKPPSRGSSTSSARGSSSSGREATSSGSRSSSSGSSARSSSSSGSSRSSGSRSAASRGRSRSDR